jgi:hypothetical protein
MHFIFVIELNHVRRPFRARPEQVAFIIAVVSRERVQQLSDLISENILE